ncbi:J domain-containing protein [Pseudomonas sp. v388]|uniref:J domain-containing protein n=1 Tax=Pseudomonas sp. v388 TaxID=2479849 RepID=UPI000F7A7ED6|nr:J domain-containing protein [Pseudomonas sp. v388]RRV03986.1 J domain-containing protein [Pseudomonas sp. v388]
MQKTPTHYQLLNVPGDASPDQIKKAYRKLAQKLHPDRNPNPSASDMMGVINAAHDVLADPVRRAAYDAHLAAQAREAAAGRGQVQAAVRAYGAASPAAAVSPSRTTRGKPQARSTGKPRPAGRRRRSVLRWAAVFLIFCAAGAWMGYDPEAGKAYVPSGSAPVAQTWVRPTPEPREAPLGNPVKLVDPTQPDCEVPALDPLGAPWPDKAGYLQGMPLRKDGGWSQITIDNTGGESAVYAKVTDAVGRNAFRHAFIPAGAVFTFGKMNPGLYLLKYKMLDSGCAFASSRILLEETPMGSQVKSSMYKLTLRKLENRNTQFSHLRSDQF